MPTAPNTTVPRESRRFAGRARLSREEVASLDYMLELVETAQQIGRKHRFEFLSYLLSLSQKEIIDVLNYSASARPSIEGDTTDTRSPVL